MPKGVPEHPDVHICHCGKECASYADFKAHLSSHIHSHLPSQGHSSSHGPGHGKERKWKCSMCPQAFISPSKLHVHFMGHMGMKPHKCDFCSKAFSDPSNLRTHLKIHTGEGWGPVLIKTLGQGLFCGPWASWRGVARVHKAELLPLFSEQHPDWLQE